MEDFLIAIAAIIALIAFIAVPVWLISGLRVSTSEQNVAGIVYNVGNDSWPMGNTNFSVRASEDTYVSEENRSYFCLPKGSKFIPLVNEAARDKTIKLNVTTQKKFYWTPNPFECGDYVTNIEKI